MSDDWQHQPPVTRAVVSFADALVTLGTDGLGYTVRMTGKAETFLDESIGFMRDARPLVVALTEAVESGMIDDVRRVLRITETAINQVALVSNRLDHAATQLAKLVPSVDRTAQGMKNLLPVIDSLPATQEDLRITREAVQRVEALVSTTLDQLEAIPGAKLIRGLGSGVVDGITGRKPPAS